MYIFPELLWEYFLELWLAKVIRICNFRSALIVVSVGLETKNMTQEIHATFKISMLYQCFFTSTTTVLMACCKCGLVEINIFFVKILSMNIWWALWLWKCRQLRVWTSGRLRAVPSRGTQSHGTRSRKRGLSSPTQRKAFAIKLRSNISDNWSESTSIGNLIFVTLSTLEKISKRKHDFPKITQNTKIIFRDLHHFPQSSENLFFCILLLKNYLQKYHSVSVILFPHIKVRELAITIDPTCINSRRRGYT